jgi:two-component system CheB/CheR fusion protein
VVCRNVLIYMQPRLQAQVLSNLHFALKPGCCLFLGPSESLGDLEHEFAVEDRKWKMFRKLRDVLLPLSGRRLTLRDPEMPSSPVKGSRNSLIPALPPEPLVNQGFNAFLRHRKSACLLVDEHSRVRYMFGHVDRYVQLATGRHSDELGVLLTRDLIVPVTTAMRRAKKSGRPVAYRGVTYRIDSRPRQAYVEVQYLAETRQWPEYYIVILEEVANASQTKGGRRFSSRGDAAARAIEQELLLTKENLQATIEELETANEEQQSSNEELLASNEELQSTNEELHSVNEELYTINAEYQQKIQELLVMTADMDHLLRSAEIGTIFLDEKLSIRKFTSSSMSVFNLTDQDVGRPISHFTSNLEFPGLLEAIKQVLERGQSLEQEVVGSDGKMQLLRLHPYRSGTPEPRGVVITVLDVSQLKRTQQALQESEERYKLMERTVQDYAMIMLDAQGRIDTWNRGAEHLFGFTAAEALGKSAAILESGQTPPSPTLTADLNHAVEHGHSRSEGQRVRRDGSTFWAEIVVYSLWDESRSLRGFVKIVHDITERRRWSEALEAANRELKKKNTEMEDFVYTVSHDLKSPLVTIGGMVTMLKEHLLKNVPVPVHEVFAKAEQTVRAMRQTIDDLLELSRIGRMAGARVDVNTHQLVSDLVESRRPMIEGAGARVVIADTLPVVHADPNRLLQVLDNLLTNAVKYGCKNGRGLIEIGGVHDTRTRRIFVRDHGDGISPEHHERIFQLFERLDQRSEGTGVGLAIVRRVMDVHNGRAWVESSPRTGATFWLEFPSYDPAAAESTATESAAIAAPESADAPAPAASLDATP